LLENNTEMIKSLRNRTVRLEHEGDYWTAEENERLKRMFSDNIGISEISLTLQRTEPAVMQQIEKLDLYGRKANPKRRKKNKKGRCPCERCQYTETTCPYGGNCPKTHNQNATEEVCSENTMI